MAIEKIVMPQLGESVTEGTLNSWHIKVGDQVNKYDPIADVMTDKVNAEVPSSFTGTITELVIQEGDTVSIGEVICHIEIADGKEPSVAVEKAETPEEKWEETPVSNDQSMKNRYSPAVLKMAQEHQIDLTQLSGSGRGGRITRKDIEQMIASGKKVETVKRTPSPQKQQEIKPTPYTGGVRKEIPVTNIRKVIAQNMVHSVTEIPHAWMTVEVDVTDLVEYRERIKTNFKQKEGYNITYFAFFVKAVAQAIKEVPLLNSTWAGDKIIQHDAINISIAVAKENELFVPVIKNAAEKSVMGIAKDIHDLATKVREGRLTADDMAGGTFTVNNTGSFGSIHSMGIINHPQAAILQVESIVKRPVIINNMFAARDMVNLCLSLDHRILDGLVCGQFMSKLKGILENMNEDTLPIY
ncbi:dihydrolipoamide acetyltransferase family protein [Ornithinibacillus sp. 4-3]|uniref:Dihydrolipoamide acetyltransferase component of pyruvate dehydrogenase complex n=1 Tax=Ornithinibacillus sp. 4-3 TaxID=3231488 RepID=A0AB39HGH6_9BACI